MLIISIVFNPFISFIPGGSEGKASARNAGDRGLISGLGRSPGEGHGNPTPVFLLGESHGQRSLVGYNIVHGVTESRTRLSDFTSLHLTHLLILNTFCLCASHVLEGKRMLNKCHVRKKSRYKKRL